MTSASEHYRTIEITPGRREEFLAVDRLAFASGTDPEVEAAVPVPLEWARTAAVENEAGVIAGIHASYEFTMPVPGAAVPCSGLTWVGVRPDHRRRGVLSSMITTHFERSLARSEPVSALFAAEPAIYGRFGYGSAADNLRLTIERGASLRDVAGSAELEVRLEPVDLAVNGDLVHGLHARAGAAQGRPGWIERSSESLRARYFADPLALREGAEEQQLLTVRDSGGVRGYALFRRKSDWGDFIPNGTVRVAELVALDPAATRRLWEFLLDLDLTTTVESPMLAADDALLHLLLNPRGTRPRVTDNLWVRLLDLPVALAGRRYAAPLDVVLEVTDARLPANAGRWRLRTVTGAAGGGIDAVGLTAEVSATSGPADLTLDVRELGAAYLGGRSLAALATAGLVAEHRAGALLGASAAFGWPVAPLCSWMF